MAAQGHAPGKIILLGEHAVVYGRPALAIPLHDLQATARIEEAKPGQGLVIEAQDLKQRFTLQDSSSDEPLAVAARLTLNHLKVDEPDATLLVTSNIPVASGLGSGAAVTTALARALAAFFEQAIPQDELSVLVYEVEKIHHGTPSGIDNTVVVSGQPVYFKRRESDLPLIETFHAGAPLHLLIADTGVASPTKIAVGDVRRRWQADPTTYNLVFDQIGRIVERGRQAIEDGAVHPLGPLMNQNQELLRKLGVSSTEIDSLVEAALSSGASGAKLSGGGRGGNVVVLIDPKTRQQVMTALDAAGATRLLEVTLHPT